MSHRSKKTKRGADKPAKAKNRKALWIALAAALALAIAVPGVIFGVKAIKNAYADSGAAYRNKIVFKTDHFSVNALMLSYCYYDYLYENDVLSNLRINDAAELQTMHFDESEDTYARYYAELTASQMESALLSAENAAQKSVTLDEKDEAAVEAKLEKLRYDAELAGAKPETYLSEHYGRGLKLSDVRAVVEIRTLAEKNAALEYGGITVSEEKIREYIAQNDDLTYYRVDYDIFDFIVGNKETDEENQKRHDECYAKAQILAQSASAEEFEELCREYLREEYADDEDFTEADLEGMMNYCIVKGRKVERNESVATEQWLFDFSRKAGDAIAVDGKKSLGALYMVKPAYSIDVPQKAVRFVRIAYDRYAKTSEALDAMRKVEALYNAGARDENAFAALAAEYSHDRLTAPGGGLEADTCSDSAFNRLIATWLETAEKGDVKSFTGEDGLYLVYCCGEGKTRSVIDAENALKTEAYRQILASYYDYAFDDDMSLVGVIAPLKERK